MYNVTIGRFSDDPQAQGVIQPEDKSWQLVIDKDGYPHLYIEVNIEDAPEGKKGLLCIEDMLPKDCTIRDLMQGSFGGQLPPEEERAAFDEWMASKEQTQIPCPR